MKINPAVLLFPIAVCALAQATREVEGVVRDQNGQPFAGAVVEIEDTRTLEVRSFDTPASGKYRFLEIDPDQDYKVRVHYLGSWSKVRWLNHFDMGNTKVINFTVRRPLE